MLVSSHLLTEVEHLADDVVVITDGHLVTHGPLDELQQTAALVRTPDPGRLATELQRAGATTRTEDDDGLVVAGMTLEEIGERAFAAGLVVHELSPRASSLEELFLTWTTRATGDEEATR